MHGRLLLHTVLFGLVAVLGTITAAGRIADGDSPFGASLVTAVGLLSLMWCQIVWELGRRRGGHVGRGWIVTAVGLPLLSLGVWLLSLAGGDNGVDLLIGGGMVVAGSLGAPGVLTANHRGRLGQAKVN